MAEWETVSEPKGFEPPDAGQQAYLAKVKAGRSVRRADPGSPQYSADLEQLRQTIVIDRANASQNEQDASQTGASWEDVPTEGDGWERVSEAQPVRSEGTPAGKEKGFLGRVAETYQKYRPKWEHIPPPEMFPGVVPPARPTTLVPTVGNVMAEALAVGAVPRDYVQGAIAGKPGYPVGPTDIADAYRAPSTNWQANVVPSILEVADEFLNPVGLLGPRGSKVPTKTPLPLEPRVLTQSQLDMQIAERSLAPKETVYGPSYDIGIHPTGGTFPRGGPLGSPTMGFGEYPVLPEGQLPLDAQLRRSALGEHGTPQTTFDDYWRTQVGEPTNIIPEGTQGELLGGAFREGQEGVAPGLRVYQPGEQLELGMVPHYMKNGPAPPFTEAELVKNRQGWQDLRFVPLDYEPFPKVPGETPLTHEPPKAILPTPDEQAILKGARFPSMPERIIPAVTDVMRKYGPIGNHMADLTDWVYGTRARDFSTDMTALDAALDQSAGRRPFWSKQKENVLQIHSDNVFVKGFRRHWVLTEGDEEAIFNHLDSHGVEPLSPRLLKIADDLFEKGSKPASMDRGVQSLQVTDPLTGNKFSPGGPNKFIPHRPVTDMAKDALSNAHWNMLYQRKGGANLGYPVDEFKKKVLAVLMYDRENVAQKMRGLESARMLDLGALGGSRYQWAKKFGLETDPYRAIAQFNAAARLRGNMAQIEQPMQDMINAIPAGDKAAKEWLTLAQKRIMIHDTAFDMTSDLTNALRGASHVTDVLRLSLAGLANLSQVIYPTARGGYINTLKSFGGMLSPTDRLVVNNSGALFPALLNEITKPTGPMATLSSAAFRGYVISPIDSFTRFFAGHVGHATIKGYERTFLKHPSSQRMQGLLRELGGDPVEILKAGKIPDDMRSLMIQKFANGSAGVTDVRGIGLWLTSENPNYKLVNKYRQFSMANAAEIQRTVLNAPDIRTGFERGVRLIAGAYVVGGGINELRKAITDSLMGSEAPKDKKGTAALLERFILGLGAAHGMILVQLAHQPAQAVANAVVGPTIGLIGQLAEDAVMTIKDGPGWRSLDTLTSLGPTGPVLGPLVDKERKKEARKLAYKKSLLDSGFSQ